MKLFQKIIFMATTAIILFSCKPVKALVNREFPPLSTIDQQYASTDANMKGLTDFNSHIGVHIDKDVINQYLPRELKKAAEAVKSDDVMLKSIEPKLSFDRQGVFVEADFLLNIPEYNVDIEGAFSGVTAISTVKDSLYLRNAIESLKVSTVKFHKRPKLSGKAMAKLITPILKNFIDNANGEIFKKPTVINIGWGEVYKLKLKEVFRDQNTEVSIDSIMVSRFVKSTSIRVKSEGISLMAELQESKPTLTVLKGGQTQGRTNSELNKLFKKYNEKFDSIWLKVYEPIDIASLTTVNISKSEIATILNTAFSKPIELKQTFEIPKSSFNEKLEVKRGDIDCQKVRTSFSYPDFNGDSCDWNCMRRVTIGVCPFCRRVRVEDPVCAASRKACRLRVEAERIVWQTARETARIAHQIENETKVGACNVWRETLDFLALGRFKGSVSGNGKAAINFDSPNFNSDLSEINLKYSGNVDGTLKSNIELIPVDLGHVFFCYTSYEKNATSSVSVNIPTDTPKIKINSEREDENLILKIKLDKIKYNASISPSPLHVLLTDPQFMVKCPIHTLIGIGSGAAAIANFLGLIKLAPEQELILAGRVNGEYGLDEMRVPFKPIIFKVNGEEKKSLLFWHDKSIQAKYLKSNGVQQQNQKETQVSQTVAKNVTVTNEN
ncbi:MULTISPECIES: hypothetical protein [Flavobacterium]|uniref:Lipoprotein n=1 Tax=Flavobacterium hankyongi TaxID=1176532 RepID=A0ABP8ZSN3_9FLAO|nr:hypothetical protein [Flavobacterium sp. N1846]